jgi:hypothetical protein
VSFLYDLHANQWVTADENTVEPRMDCGGILATPAGLVILGGMTKGQTATALATLFARK